jgi:hypothetical protein
MHKVSVYEEYNFYALRQREDCYVSSMLGQKAPMSMEINKSLIEEMQLIMADYTQKGRTENHLGQIMSQSLHPQEIELLKGIRTVRQMIHQEKGVFKGKQKLQEMLKHYLANNTRSKTWPNARGLGT